MKEEINFIKTRRSKRKFLNKEVSVEMVKELIDVARYAPSSRNSQPWDFVIIRDGEIKKKIAELKEEANQGHILGSNLIIVVCVDTEKSKARWVEDGVSAAMNILLSAHILGLGAVYVTGYSETDPEATLKLKEMLELPERIMPVVLIPIGFADPVEEIEKKELRGMDEIIHFDKW